MKFNNTKDNFKSECIEKVKTGFAASKPQYISLRERTSISEAKEAAITAKISPA